MKTLDTKLEKGVLIDEDDNYIFIGFSEEEIKLAKESPAAFEIWLELNKIK